MSMLRSANKKESKDKKKKERTRKIVQAFDCYRCHKPVRLTREENQPGKLFDVFWINYREDFARLCPSCTQNFEEWLGVKPYQTEDLTAS